MTIRDEDRLEIVRRFQGGASFRAIARALHLDRKTVTDVIRRFERSRTTPHSLLSGPRGRRSPLDAYAADIAALIERYPDITAVRLHEELRVKGFTGGHTSVKDRLRRLRPLQMEREVGIDALLEHARQQEHLRHARRDPDFPRIARLVRLRDAHRHMTKIANQVGPKPGVARFLGEMLGQEDAELGIVSAARQAAEEQRTSQFRRPVVAQHPEFVVLQDAAHIPVAAVFSAAPAETRNSSFRYSRKLTPVRCSTFFQRVRMV